MSRRAIRACCAIAIMSSGVAGFAAADPVPGQGSVCIGPVTIDTLDARELANVPPDTHGRAYTVIIDDAAPIHVPQKESVRVRLDLDARHRLQVMGPRGPHAQFRFTFADKGVDHLCLWLMDEDQAFELTPLYDARRLCGCTPDHASGDDEPVGTVFGETVRREEIRASRATDPTAAPRAAFARPVLTRYRNDRHQELWPTAEQIDAFAAHIRADAQASGTAGQLDPLLRVNAATHQASNWKFQRHVYRTYGGGRLLVQQAGFEAFDATRRLLEELEGEGQFSLANTELRDAVYDYWTRNHGAWLLSDPAQIDELLEPAFLKKSTAP